MDQSSLRERITDQFSYRGQRSDIWKAFDIVLDTEAFLNLGYSEWYQPHTVGSSQRRLVTEVGMRLASHLPVTDGVRLLDVGCGRGAPAIHLDDKFGFDATGLDLVPYNVERATENARDKCVEAEFVIGDATQLPFTNGSFGACTAIDVFVYLPERNRVFAAVADTLEPEGVFVLSDLVMQPSVNETERRIVDSFAEEWDMPSLGTVERYKAALDDTGFELTTVEDITGHSVGRFQKWTTVFLWLVKSPLGPLIERLVHSYGLDSSKVFEQVKRAHQALPLLQHVILVAKKKNS